MLDPLQVGNQDGEFVAAQARQAGGIALAAFSARDQVAGTGGFAQPFRDHLEQLVAGVVAQRVVDALEGVEVHEQHRELLVADLGALQLALQRLEKGLPVGDAGQAVAIGQAPDLFLGALAFADVAHQAQHLGRGGGDQARLEVQHLAAFDQFVLDRAHLLGGEHGLHLIEHARRDLGRQRVGQVLADEARARQRAAVRASRTRLAGPLLAGPLLAGLIVEIEAVRVQAEEGVGDGFEHGAVLGVGDAQAGDGVAGAQHVQHAVAEDRPVDRLGDEVGGADLVGLGHGLDVVAAGDHDDRDAGAVRIKRADRAAGREAVHARHVDVHQDQVRHALARQLDRFQAVGGLDTFHPDLGQHLEHQEAHDGIVVGDEHRPALGGGKGWHVRIPFQAWRGATGAPTGIRAPCRPAGAWRRRRCRCGRAVRGRGRPRPGAPPRCWRWPT